MEKDFITIIRHVISVSYIFMVIPFLLLFANKIGINDEKQWIRTILFISSIAGVISICCLLFPSFNEYVKDRLIQYEEDDYLYGTKTRGFGIASSLTSAYGYIQGTIVVLGLYYFKENKWFLLFIPAVFASALINARTGVLMTFWGIMVLNMSTKLSSIIPSLGIMIGFIFYLEDIMKYVGFNEETIAWILDFQNQLGDMTTGDISSGAAGKITNSMVIWPSGITEWIMGKGINLFDIKDYGVHSDIGWIIQLNYGGLSYIIPLYFAFVMMAKRLVSNNQYSLMMFIMGISIIANTKSKLFPSTGLFTLLMLVYVITIKFHRVSNKLTNKQKSKVR